MFPNLKLPIPWIFALIGGVAAPAAAQEGAPIFVSFEFGEASVAGHFGNQAIEVQDQIAGTLARACQEDDQMSYWRFQSGHEANLPRLAVQLEHGLTWRVRMALVLEREQRGPWFCEMFKPGEIERWGLPAPDDWPTRVAQGFGEGFLGGAASGAEIVKTLRELVPLGKKVSFLDEAVTQAVLPLDWEQYRELTSSWFRILCFYRGDMVVLRSQAKCAPHPYPGASYQGILVEHRKWVSFATQQEEDIQQHLEALGEIQPLVFHLDNLDDLALWRFCENPLSVAE